MHCVRVCVCPCIRVCVHVCRAQISVTFLISKAASVHGHEDDVDGDDDNDDHYHAGLNRLMIREQFLLTTV